MSEVCKMFREQTASVGLGGTTTYEFVINNIQYCISIALYLSVDSVSINTFPIQGYWLFPIPY